MEWAVSLASVLCMQHGKMASAWRCGGVSGAHVNFVKRRRINQFFIAHPTIHVGRIFYEGALHKAGHISST